MTQRVVIDKSLNQESDSQNKEGDFEMKKKALAVLLCVGMVAGLVGCGSKTTGAAATETEETVETTAAAESTEEGTSAEAGEAAGTHIYVLTPTEDHGWTGSVATFAKESAEAINQEGTYTAEVITSADANEQISQIEDIIANYKGDGKTAVAMLPQDDTVESAIQQLIDAGIPYTAFDRIIEGVAASAVANVKGDNSGIGAATAAYFVGLGMKPGEKVYVYQGDTSSVTTLRDIGFVDYLLGNLEYEGAAIAEDAKWTQEQIDSAIVYTGAMNWSRSTAKEHFESLMSDSANADIKWFYAEDDELAMGIIEALNGSGIDDTVKEKFLGNQPVVSGCGGLAELYDVIGGKQYADIVGQFGGIMSATYNPSMIQTTIELMVDYLDGKTVEQDCVVPVKIVTADNVDEFEPFS